MKRVSTAATLVLAATAPAFADVVWTGASGSLAASATFSVSGGNLVITLENTSASQATIPSDLLSGVYFNITGTAPTLTPVSAVLGAGADVMYDSQPAGGVVGGEFGFRQTANLYLSRRYGISASGLDLFGPGDRFPGNNLAGPTSPDGLQYGMVPLIDTTAGDNGGLQNSEGLIRGSVVFTLSGLPQNFNLSRITDVLFFYGTSFDQPQFTGTPTPGAAALLGIGGLMVARRRRSA